MRFIVPEPDRPVLPVNGTDSCWPVRRIYCVGRNYAAHAREMGHDPQREPPFFFLKPADTIAAGGGEVAYPPGTEELHHEVELVVAIGGHGRDLDVAAADALVFGYAVGIDLTRRDLQAEAKRAGRPWDTAKGFDASAPVSAITLREQCGTLASGRIWLDVNGERRQQGDLADLVWAVPELIGALSRLFALVPGDLVFTGTPAGVGPLVVGDRIDCGVDGLEPLVTVIAPPV